MTTTDPAAGPGGCHAALNVRGEHFWCDEKAPHPGLPHGNTGGQAVWRGEGAAEDPAVAWREVAPEGER